MFIVYKSEMPSESTIKQYEMRMAKLRKDKVQYNILSDLLKWFEKEELGASSQKVYLSAIKHSNPEGFPAPLQEKLNDLYKAQSKRDTQQTLTDTQQERFVKWDEIAKLQEEFPEPKTTAKWKQYLVVSLYTLNAPVRADYAEMEVHTKYDKKRTGNELIWNKTPKFIFRKYKTAKTYGEVSIPVSKPLQKVIADWFNHLGNIPPYLLGSPSTPNTFAVYVASTFKQLLGKELGVSMLRHAYITHMFPKLKSIKQKQDLAQKMLHSKDLQEKYVSLKDMD